MSHYPDFSTYGYQVISELGHNSIGGRVTYLATDTKTQERVVIKQFQFAQLGSTWSEYEAYEQEIIMLRHLHHPGIPRYLNSFQTADGFCMVQEYINAQSLATSHSWRPKQIKQIAISILEILVYLQSQQPAVIHRDIKSENILIDEQMQVYLVDFGFARMGGGEIAASSLVKGTMGFMPPEQLFNRQLTIASDLYGLGATLICLLTGTKSIDIGNLTDDNYRIHFRHLVPPLKRGWINWLEKMTEPRPQDRYGSAAEALTALQPIDVDRLPKVRISQENLHFKASQYREKLVQTLTLSNPIPQTVLSGRWEVASHPSDPPHTPYDHAWICFKPQKFEGNQVECEITVDTSNLRVSQTYICEILLHTNSSPETYRIPVIVQTSPLPKIQKNPYLSLILIGGIGCIIGFLLNSFYHPVFMSSIIAMVLIIDQVITAQSTHKSINEFDLIVKTLFSHWFGVIVGILVFRSPEISLTISSGIGACIGIILSKYKPKLRQKDANISMAITMWFFALSLLWMLAELPNNLALFLGICLTIIIVVLLPLILALNFVIAYSLKPIVNHHLKSGVDPMDIAPIVLLTCGLGISLVAVFVNYLAVLSQLQKGEGTLLMLALTVGVALITLTVILIPLLHFLISRPWQQKKIIAQYYKSEASLIKP